MWGMLARYKEDKCLRLMMLKDVEKISIREILWAYVDLGNISGNFWNCQKSQRNIRLIKSYPKKSPCILLSSQSGNKYTSAHLF